MRVIGCAWPPVPGAGRHRVQSICFAACAHRSIAPDPVPGAAEIGAGLLPESQSWVTAALVQMEEAATWTAACGNS